MGIEPTSQPWQGRVLTVILHLLERVMGVEPTYPAWKAGVLADVLHPHIMVISFELLKQPNNQRGDRN